MPVLEAAEAILTGEPPSRAVVVAMLMAGATERPLHDVPEAQATVGTAIVSELVGSVSPPLGQDPVRAVQVNCVPWNVTFQPLPVPVVSVTV